MANSRSHNCGPHHMAIRGLGVGGTDRDDVVRPGFVDTGQDLS